MIYLALKTDNPVAELYIYKDEEQIAHDVWQADRRLALELLGHIEKFLSTNQLSFKDLSGLLVYRGPGSFTGLRIGITVMNAISYAQSIPIAGEVGENWLEDGIDRLMNEESDRVVLPEYGAEARITKPKK